MHPHRPIRFNLIAIRCQIFIGPYRSIIRIVVALQQDSYRFLTTPQSANAMLHGMHAWEGGLPRERGADEVTRTARRTEEGAYGGGTRVKRVLLVEDHRLIREGLAVMLEERTDLKKTVQAGSLAEVRRIWGHLPGEIDMAIVDLDLPNGEGISLIKNLRQAEPEVPVLALTATRDVGRRARALRAGANEVLSTASSGENIVGVVQRLVGG
jgi:CheY-like chemotaxis protein